VREFARALLAFLALPGMVAYAAPLWLAHADPHAQPFRARGWPLVALGTFLLSWCVRDFYVAGKGTLAPWAPPKRLVVVGPYRFSRNPMYIAVVLILLGWALGFGSRVLFVYAGVVAFAFHLRVVLAEEPFLARTHGEAWQRYRARVPRWVGVWYNGRS
jgi:protein-S-isoprenylcysteine O-methyltransferase Ste14